MKCTHIVFWTSAVTGNKISSGVSGLSAAKKLVANLEKEGAKEVGYCEYKPCKIY